MRERTLSRLKVGGPALLLVGAVALINQHRTGAAEDPPKTARYYRQQAAAAYKAKDYASAIDNLKKALQLIPDHPTLFYNIAAISALQGKKTEAIASLSRVADMGLALRPEKDPDMGGELKLLQEWRERAGEGTMAGPHMYGCGPLLDGPKPMWPGSVAISTAEQGRQAVRDLKKQRADFVKVYSLLPRDAYFAIAEEAKRLKIPFAGHVPDSVSPEEASDAGQASEEHLLQIVEACSDRDAIKKKVDALRDAGATPAERRRAYIETMLATFDNKKAEALFAKFVKNNTWITPTAIVWQNNASFEEDSAKYAERMKYLPRYIREYWDPKNNAHLRNRSPERLAAEKLLVKKYLEIIGGMQRAGVRLMTGSDFGANPLLFPGWGVHDEMALLVKAGLTPLEAIQAATRNPATFLRLDKAVGTIEKGKLADIVVLSANPLEDINNTRKVNAVIFQGRMFDRADLNRMLASAAINEGAK